MTVKKAAGKIDKFKQRLEPGIDKIQSFVAGNAAALIAIKEGSEQLQLSEFGDDMYMVGSGIGLAALNYLAFKAPVAQKLRDGVSRINSSIDDRRVASWIKTLALSGAVTFSGVGLHNQYVDSVEESEPQEMVSDLDPNHYLTGDLSGKTVGDLYVKYLGKENAMTFPDTVVIDYNESLATLWDKKDRRAKGNSVVDQMIDDVIPTYDVNSSTKMSIEEYIAKADAAVTDVKKDIVWSEVASEYNLDDKELSALKLTLGKIDGKALIAYGMTEILPTDNGEFNVDYIDFILSTAGREYLEFIPALYDAKTSFGTYQFTEYALFDLGNEQRGASRFEKALSEDHIPGSVMHLEGDDHHKAAYLFAAHNLAVLINQLTDDQLDCIEDAKKSELVKYIACAHHAPANARTAAKRWLDNNMDSDFTVSTSGRLINYSKKTNNNFDAVADLNVGGAGAFLK